MIGNIICIGFLLITVVSICVYLVRKKIAAKEKGLPASCACCSCAGKCTAEGKNTCCCK